MYVIIQAGGRGVRLGKYTYNKPKALLSVDGLPLILRMFKIFSGSYFVVIADYKYEVLQKYLLVFAPNVKYTIIRATGRGTCAGIKEALNYIPDHTPFVLTWCDLYFGEGFKLESLLTDLNTNLIGISRAFECRWSYKNGQFVEEPSADYGVAGFFIFKNKEQIRDVPIEGEFVRYLSKKNLDFEPLFLDTVTEFGTVERYEEHFKAGISRPFNAVVIAERYVEKLPLDEKGKQLAEKEKNWYRFVTKQGFQNIPKVLSYEPFRLEKIAGNHPFQIEPNRTVLEKIVSALIELHEICAYTQSDWFSVDKEYFIKTYERLLHVKNLIPYADDKEIKINGKICPNPYYLIEDLQMTIKEYYPDRFKVIHGDPTFSNTLIGVDGKVYFIDPRGYFGYTDIYGDEDYDFAKLYYSVVGNYDNFNRRKFTLRIFENNIKLDIESSGYEKYEDEIIKMIGSKKRRKIKLLHAIIWLSLTTYVWDDYDMICGAFYNGTLKLREVLEG